MTRHLLILLLFCASCFGQAVVPNRRLNFQPAATTTGNLNVDWYLTMTNGAIGTVVTAAIMTNGTLPVTSGLWSKTGTGKLHVGGHTNNLHSTVTVGAVTIPVDFANHSLCLSNTSANEFTTWEMDTSIADRKMTIAGWVYLAVTNKASGQPLFDLVSMQGEATGQSVVAQLQSGPSGTYVLEIESNPGGVTTHSSNINVNPRTWYWLSLKGDYNTGVGQCSLYVYDTNFALVGSVTSTNSVGENINPAMHLGQNEGGAGGNSSDIFCFEHIVGAHGAKAIQPLGP